MARSTTIIGLDRLNRKLKKLPLAAEKRIKEAMAKGADEMVALAKSIVPVDDGVLRDSISWTWGDAPKGALSIGTVKSSDGSLRLTIYAGGGEAYYARFVEFGTDAHVNGGMFAGTAHPGTRRTGFFYGSWRPLRRRIRSRITRAITKSAKEVAAGGG